MKNDREFLDGIYQKARMIEDNAVAKPKKIDLSFVVSHRILGAVAAVFLLIAIPSVTYASQPQMEIPSGYIDLAPSIGKTRIHAAPPQTGDGDLFEYSDIICTAKVLKIENSVYEKDNERIITNVQIKPNCVLKGESVDKVLTIQVKGGFDKNTKAYLDYEATFAQGEDVLLFLEKDLYSNSYILYGSSLGKYTYLAGQGEAKSYIDKNGLSVSIAGLRLALL